MLVRPHLEYANAIWGPFYKQDQQLVERVQWRATKMISCSSNLSYGNRIRSLNMPSLHHGRKRGDMITTYKIMTKRYRVQSEKLFHIRHCTTRGHPFKIYKQHAKSFTRRSSLSCRIVNDWNALPTEKSLECLKTVKIIEVKNVNKQLYNDFIGLRIHQLHM